MPALKLRGQRLVSEVRSGHGQNAASLPIEPMNNAGTQVAVNRRQSSEVMQESVHQRSIVVPGSRVNDHAGRFVHDYHILILIQDLQRQFFGLGSKRRKCGRRDGDSFVPFDQSRGPGFFAIDQNQTLL